MFKKSFLIVAAVFALAVAGTASAAPSGKTIVGIASSNPNFTTLTAAVVCTGLAPTLDGNRQFTVFAPTDAAFANLGLNAGNICSALPKATLTSILLYHVAPGARYAADVVGSERVRTMSKSFLFPSVSKGNAYLKTTSGSSAQIVATDIQASNGVIHVVDSVLLP